jgi:hypothetical protein
MIDTTMEKVVKGMEKIRKREEKELNELCKNPDTFKIVQAFADQFIGNLNYLCNFKFITAGNGKECDILEVIQRLQRDTMIDVQRLTGRKYILPVCRDFREMKTERTNGSKGK